jgi:hypothetical protein
MREIVRVMLFLDEQDPKVVVQAFDRNLKALRAFAAKQGGALATFQKEKITLDGQGDELHFGGPERAARIPGDEYEDE